MPASQDNSLQARNRSFEFQKRGQLFIGVHDTVIHVYDSIRNVIETHEHAGKFKKW